MDIKYLLGINHRLPLSHMGKSYIWLEETNQRINEFFTIYDDESKFEYKQNIQKTNESMFENHIFYINYDTKQ